MADLANNLSPAEAKAVLNRTSQIMNAQVTQSKPGQVFYPTTIAKQGVISPKKWAKMSHAQNMMTPHYGW